MSSASNSSLAQPVSISSRSSTASSELSLSSFLRHGIPPRPSTSTSVSHSYTNNLSRSVTSSSHPSGQRCRPSTASGRKSRANSSLWSSDSQVVICAVAEARGVSPSVGLAFINITTNEAVLSQLCDTQFYVRTIHKIQMYEPSTILMVNTAMPPHLKSNLLSIIEAELPDANMEGLDRKYWSEHAGLEFIQCLAFRDDLEAIKVAIGGNFYATCSFAAVREPHPLPIPHESYRE